MAAYLGAAIGAFAMGLVVLLNESGIFTAPSLYPPAGGLSGRTTIAVVVWLVGWVVLHQRWKKRQIETRRTTLLALILIGLGILFTFPPVWSVIS